MLALHGSDPPPFNLKRFWIEDKDQI